MAPTDRSEGAGAEPLANRQPRRRHLELAWRHGRPLRRVEQRLRRVRDRVTATRTLTLALTLTQTIILTLAQTIILTLAQTIILTLALT